MSEGNSAISQEYLLNLQECSYRYFEIEPPRQEYDPEITERIIDNANSRGFHGDHIFDVDDFKTGIKKVFGQTPSKFEHPIKYAELSILVDLLAGR